MIDGLARKHLDLGLTFTRQDERLIQRCVAEVRSTPPPSSGASIRPVDHDMLAI